MSKSLVTYFSKTGNTKAVAEAIYGALEVEKAMKSLHELQGDISSEFNLIFIGFPVHSHSIPFSVEEFLKKIPRAKKIAFFSTHGSLTGSRLSREALEYATVIASQVNVLGTFSCRGKVSPQTLKVLEKSPEHQAWAEMTATASTHPDKADLEDARSFAKWIMTLAAL